MHKLVIPAYKFHTDLLLSFIVIVFLDVIEVTRAMLLLELVFFLVLL